MPIEVIFLGRERNSFCVYSHFCWRVAANEDYVTLTSVALQCT